jgi:PIN domain nuclease of toxin-antitoxin system
MSVILDTHTFLWAVDDYDQLSPAAHAALADPSQRLFVSTATVWELAIKVSLGKLSLSLPYHDWMIQSISDFSITVLPLSIEHADILSRLEFHHRDPFDRALIAQATSESWPIVSCDTTFDAYGIARIW